MIRPHQNKLLASDGFIRWGEDKRLMFSAGGRGSCGGNAVAESFFSGLKKEQVKRCIYPTHDDAKSDLFDHVEGLFNPVRGHSHLDPLSRVDFERLRTGR
ncbi:MAG: IS3 family transposase [Burkholderiaceae bacterium]